MITTVGVAAIKKRKSRSSSTSRSQIDRLY
jgi:hypothetical protein